MTLAIHGLAVARGIAYGRAVLIASGHVDVAHYFIDPGQVESETLRFLQARDAVCVEVSRVRDALSPDAPPEMSALLEVHLMLLQDPLLEDGVKSWVQDRLYNAEWALTSQLEQTARHFDEIEDPYLRERKVDLEQVIERVLRHLKEPTGVIGDGLSAASHAWPVRQQTDVSNDQTTEDALILISHDLSPIDILNFNQSVFAGFVTDIGGKTSHSAIVARSLDIPAVVGVRLASQLIRPDDMVIIDGDAGVVIVDPSPGILDEYALKKRESELEQLRLSRLNLTPSLTLDGVRIELLANIEFPEDTDAALGVGAVGVGLFRSEFLFMGRNRELPDEEQQYNAYCRVLEGMRGLPVTVRTVDIGADKPLDKLAHGDAHLNPALGLRAIRWSLADPNIFLCQLRALLRAAARGQINILFPMLAHATEIRQTLALLNHARLQLDHRGLAYGPVKLGAMIEVPAAALTLPLFLRHFDFLSIGTNDLTQYTLAIDRSDESVAHLYDPLHPAVLRLVAETIQAGHRAGKTVSVCGEMAGDPQLTRLLLGLGLRSFSMHATQILAVKQAVLRADTEKLAVWAQSLLESDEPASLL